ncbi:MAG: hypothetical protein KKA10_16350 [Euryarchaeota archaeon]|nr:hypothetical protein [Euryarchaeota archaeon]MCG2738287.1 hypothetical protein [Candidatus Methanoperedenaceae archaeon]
MRKMSLLALFAVFVIIPVIVNASSSFSETWSVPSDAYKVLKYKLNSDYKLVVDVSSITPIDIMLATSEQYPKFIELANGVGGRDFKYLIPGSCFNCLSKSYEYNVLVDDTYYIIVWNKANEDAYVSVYTDVIVPKATPKTPAYTSKTPSYVSTTPERPKDTPGFEIFTLIVALGIMLVISRRR